jgi:hypothetical protein
MPPVPSQQASQPSLLALRVHSRIQQVPSVPPANVIGIADQLATPCMLHNQYMIRADALQARTELNVHDH